MRIPSFFVFDIHLSCPKHQKIKKSIVYPLIDWRIQETFCFFA